MSEESAGRGRVAVLSAAGVVAVVVASALVVVGVRHSVQTVADPGVWVAVTAQAAPSPSATPSDPPSPSERPSPSPSPSPKKAKTPTKKATVKPVPSHPKVAGPPRAAPSPPAGCAKTYVGTAASRADVGAALDAASQDSYQPSITSVPERSITVSASLIKAVAWQESGWQSNVQSCYQAFGAMQVTADTAKFMNDNYGTDDDRMTLSGNVTLGADYLAWLIYYFGHFCFADSYDITKRDPNAPDLLDAVLAGYNVGFANVDTAKGVVISTEARQYTNAVEGLMVSQPWNS
jgi:soluble lytic murein transglycosylase-like protein